MLDGFRKAVENKLGYQPESAELNAAIEATKDDAFSNCILFDKDVSPSYFVIKVCEYISCVRRFQ